MISGHVQQLVAEVYTKRLLEIFYGLIIKTPKRPPSSSIEKILFCFIKEVGESATNIIIQ